MNWLAGLYGEYDYTTRKYGVFKYKHDAAKDYHPVLCLATDSQLAATDGALEKGLHEAGFIRLGGFKTVHGTYLCNLFFLDPRYKKGQQGNNAGNAPEDFRFYPSAEAYMGHGKADLKKEALRGLKEKYEALVEENRRHIDALAAAREDLDGVKMKLAEAKATLAEKRALRKRSLLTSSRTKKGMKAPLSGTRRATGVGMRRVFPAG